MHSGVATTKIRIPRKIGNALSVALAVAAAPVTLLIYYVVYEAGRLFESDWDLSGLNSVSRVWETIDYRLEQHLYSGLDDRIEAAINGAVMLTVIAIICLILRDVNRRRNAAVQRDRDEFAHRVATQLSEGGDAPAFSLYLRPFFTDGQLAASEGLARLNPFDIANFIRAGAVRDSEYAFAKAFEDEAPLIAIGDTDGRIGAGKAVSSDDTWYDLFRLLAGHARRIVVVPVAQPATLNEIDYIFSQPELLEKTIFGRPSNKKRAVFQRRSQFGLNSLGTIWDRSRETFLGFVRDFPRFRDGTMVFRFRQGAIVPYRGDAFCSSEQSAALKDFVIHGKDYPLSWAGCLVWLAILTQMVMAHQMMPTISPVIMRFLLAWVLLVILPVTVGTAFYKFVKGDIPVRMLNRQSIFSLSACALMMVNYPFMTPMNCHSNGGQVSGHTFIGLPDQMIRCLFYGRHDFGPEANEWAFGWTRYILGERSIFGDYGWLVYLFLSTLVFSVMLLEFIQISTQRRRTLAYLPFAAAGAFAYCLISWAIGVPDFIIDVARQDAGNLVGGIMIHSDLSPWPMCSLLVVQTIVLALTVFAPVLVFAAKGPATGRKAVFRLVSAGLLLAFTSVGLVFVESLLQFWVDMGVTGIVVQSLLFALPIACLPLVVRPYVLGSNIPAPVMPT